MHWEMKKKKYDVSPERMFQVLQIIGEDIEEIETLCKRIRKRYANRDEINIRC